MPRPQPLNIVAALLVEIAHNVHSRYNATIDNLELAQPGYPTQCIGAGPPPPRKLEDCHYDDCDQTRPCPTHDNNDPGESTIVERSALKPNQAAADAIAFELAIRNALKQLDIADRISHRWGMVVQQAIDNIWCDNCSNYGRHEPRLAQRTECSFCRDFRLEFKRPAPKAVWDARDARGGSIDKANMRRIMGTNSRNT